MWRNSGVKSLDILEQRMRWGARKTSRRWRKLRDNERNTKTTRNLQILTLIKKNSNYLKSIIGNGHSEWWAKIPKRVSTWPSHQSYRSLGHGSFSPCSNRADFENPRYQCKKIGREVKRRNRATFYFTFGRSIGWAKKREEGTEGVARKTAPGQATLQFQTVGSVKPWSRWYNRMEMSNTHA